MAMTVSAAFKRFRTEFNLTQTEIAKTLGIKATSYSFEDSRKEANPTAKTLIKLAAKYRVSVDYLLGLTDNPKPNITQAAEMQVLKKKLAELQTTVTKIAG